MARSPTRVFEKVLHNADPDTDSPDRPRPITRSELADAVKDGVREGIEEHEQSHHGEEHADGGADQSSRRLLTAKRIPPVLVAVVALTYLRKRRTRSEEPDETE